MCIGNLADEVKTVVINEVPIWIILVAIIGWLLPTPTQIGAGVGGFFVRLFSRKE